MGILDYLREKFNKEIKPDSRQADINKVVEFEKHAKEKAEYYNIVNFEKRKAMLKEQQEKPLETADANAIRMKEQEGNRKPMHIEVPDPLKDVKRHSSNDDFTRE